MQNEQFVLKIKQDGKIFLSAIDVEEELVPLKKLDVIRSLSGKTIALNPQENFKYRYRVKTNYPPDISLLQLGNAYEICPVMVFKAPEKKTETIPKTYDLIEKRDNFIYFRPIFNMILTNYQINNSNNAKWTFEFEEA